MLCAPVAEITHQVRNTTLGMIVLISRIDAKVAINPQKAGGGYVIAIGNGTPAKCTVVLLEQVDQ